MIVLKGREKEERVAIQENINESKKKKKKKKKKTRLD